MNKKLFLLLGFVLLLSTSCQKEDKHKPKPLDSKKMRNTDKAPAGLKTKVLKDAGKHAPKPAVGNTVAVHYQAWLLNKDGSRGKVIDSSIARNEPLTFTLGLAQVIPGFESGVLLMRVGEKRQLIISPELAYGERGMGLFIPPHSTLEFEVELIGFN